ncbi:MAG: type II secretion system protein [Acidobacteria bacterium]|nr:type II secretion system protein [Acidobacteriota bacterium]
MRRLRRQEGLSLVEVTIMLLVLMLLTSVLAPSIMDYFKDAQWVKVKEDCEAIGITVVRMMRDVPPCLRKDGGAPCTITNRVDLLYSDGTASGALAGQATTNYTTVGANGTQPWNWSTATTVQNDTMENQFTRNTPVTAPYPVPSSFVWAGGFPVGPLFGLGWRGSYLSAPIGPDPWGMAYMVNTGFLSPATNAITGPPAEGQNGTIWDRDVFCISAGPNRLYETYFGGCNTLTNWGTCRQGDDWTFTIQGSSR